jgi:hypothetical protein
MKKLLLFTIAVVSGLFLGPFAIISADNQMMPAPIVHSADFERMKGLVGAWEGKVDMGHGMETLKVTYELTSAENAILERFAAGQPHEMVTVYHDRSGKLTMTHYCSLGNQPHMELTNPGETTMKFVLSEKEPNLVSLNEMHMHALTITVDGKDTISHTWTLYDKGVKKSDVSVKLMRTRI